MKYLILVLLPFFMGFTSIHAQDIANHAIGLRLGDSDGFGVGISYQRALADTNRLEVDLGWRSGNNYEGYKLVGLYQWLFHLDGNFNWYTGAGAGFGTYHYDYPNNNINESFAFLAGNAGIEYCFDTALLLSFDI